MRRTACLITLLAGLLTSVTGLAQSAADIFQRAGHSVGIVLVGNRDGKLISAGSAVAVDPHLMVTNYHVVTDDASRLYVFLNSRRYDAYVSRCEKERDLCLIDVQGLDVPPVELGSADDLKVGDTSYAIGGPNEVLYALAVSAATHQKQISPPQVTLSQGMITALRPLADGTLIQTSAPISPGSSGGGLFDARGRLIGITTFQMKNGQNVNFALPVAWVRNMGVSGGVAMTDPTPTTSIGASASNESINSLPQVAAEALDTAPTKAPAAKPTGNPSAMPKGIPHWSAVLIGLLALLGLTRWWLRRQRSQHDFDFPLAATTIPAADAVDPEFERMATKVADELARGEVDEALWATIQPYAVGDPEKAKTLYTKRRVPQLISAEKEQRWREAVARTQGTPPPPPGR